MNEAELLFTEIFNCNRLSLYLNRELPVFKHRASLLSSVLKKRMRGLPLQYILGKVEFMGLEFKLTPDVFIPRPETEVLVEAAIAIVNGSKFRINNILDLGTGSGCIAVSLATFLRNTALTATDISRDAIAIARQNALRHQAKITFLLSDLFQGWAMRANCYELIVANPPYIATTDMQVLQREVRYEPRIALDGGVDGLDFYRRIISGSWLYLKENGFLVLEMGWNQCGAIKEIFRKSRTFAVSEVIKDYNNIERVIVAQKKRLRHG